MPEVRRAVEADFDAVHRLLEQLMSGDRAHREAVWREALRRDDYAAWIAEAKGRPAGFLDLCLFLDVSHGGTIGLVNNLVVDAACRGEGVGRRLLEEAVRHSRGRGMVEVHVWTGRDNAPALRLYQRAGFAPRAVLLELELPKV
jgi:GNAT superfamily N-acetyltransferase